MLAPSCPVELALYADDTAVLVTSHHPALLVKYLETYLSDLERWLSEWRMAINIWKISTISSPRQVGASRNTEQYRSSRSNPMADDAHYLWVTVDKRLTWSKHRSGEKQNGREAGNAENSPKQEKRSLNQEWCSAV